MGASTVPGSASSPSGSRPPGCAETYMVLNPATRSSELIRFSRYRDDSVASVPCPLTIPWTVPPSGSKGEVAAAIDTDRMRRRPRPRGPRGGKPFASVATIFNRTSVFSGPVCLTGMCLAALVVPSNRNHAAKVIAFALFANAPDLPLPIGSAIEYARENEAILIEWIRSAWVQVNEVCGS